MHAIRTAAVVIGLAAGIALGAAARAEEMGMWSREESTIMGGSLGHIELQGFQTTDGQGSGASIDLKRIDESAKVQACLDAAHIEGGSCNADPDGTVRRIGNNKKDSVGRRHGATWMLIGNPANMSTLIGAGYTREECERKRAAGAAEACVQEFPTGGLMIAGDASEAWIGAEIGPWLAPSKDEAAKRVQACIDRAHAEGGSCRLQYRANKPDESSEITFNGDPDGQFHSVENGRLIAHGEVFECGIWTSSPNFGRRCWRNADGSIASATVDGSTPGVGPFSLSPWAKWWNSWMAWARAMQSQRDASAAARVLDLQSPVGGYSIDTSQHHGTWMLVVQTHGGVVSIKAGLTQRQCLVAQNQVRPEVTFEIPWTPSIVALPDPAVIKSSACVDAAETQ